MSTESFAKVQIINKIGTRCYITTENLKMKRYRRPKVVKGQIKMQKGRIDGDAPDMCIFYGDGVPRCDLALVMSALCSKRQYTDLSTMKPAFDPSLIDELEKRGYDLDTLQFSIKRKVI